jgi:cysteine synthase A
VFSDSNKKYLSTDLLREEPVRPDYVAPGVELEWYEAIPRVCVLCSSIDQIRDRLAAAPPS